MTRPPNADVLRQLARDHKARGTPQGDEVARALEESAGLVQACDVAVHLYPQPVWVEVEPRKASAVLTTTSHAYTIATRPEHEILEAGLLLIARGIQCINGLLSVSSPSRLPHASDRKRPPRRSADSPLPPKKRASKSRSGKRGSASRTKTPEGSRGNSPRGDNGTNWRGNAFENDDEG